MVRLALLFVLCICTGYGQTSYMIVHLKGAPTTSIPLQDIQKISFQDFTDVKDATWATVIKSFILLQNYPNPFNPTTTIEYQLPQSGNVQISIFNINGQLVKSLESNDESSGKHSVVWDSRNNSGQTVASGLYVCQVTFDNSMLVRKMLLIK